MANDSQGNAYFMVAQSREHNGYLTLLKVDAALIDKGTDAIIVKNEGAVVGKAIWQDVYTGSFNGNSNPVGNWNHPGKMSYIDGMLAIAGQNWDMESGKKFVCGHWYSALGSSEDTVLFYDMRNVANPQYVGGITAGEMGVKNRELASVDITYDTAAGKYILNAGGDGAYPVYSSETLNPGFQNWSPVPSGANFTGQHGLAFDADINNSNQLWYFDASRSDDKFSFTNFDYSANTPFLTTVKNQSVPMKLPGANRDWDASSIYIAATVARKPIIYTVKSLDGANYQLYQIVPGN